MNVINQITHFKKDQAIEIAQENMKNDPEWTYQIKQITNGTDSYWTVEVFDENYCSLGHL